MAEKSSETVGTVHANERMAGNNYHEKNGMRIDGDGEDHDHETPVSLPCVNKTQC